jgi:alginate O-acetyltransferase complex protein AlgI
VGILLGAIVVAMCLLYLVQRGLKLSLNWYLKIFLVPVCLYLVWMLAPNGSPVYIYFDF